MRPLTFVGPTEHQSWNKIIPSTSTMILFHRIPPVISFPKILPHGGDVGG